MDKIKLFCFSYAGGSVSIFRDWKDHLHPSIELCPVEIAGRGRRMSEGMYKDMAEAIEDVSAIVKREIKGEPYALYGHSLGSRICYHLAHNLANDKAVADPQHIFFSGNGAPHVLRADKKKYHLMDDEEFKKEVFHLGGTPQEFFDHPELLDLFLPILKNDFRIAETTIAGSGAQPLDTDISILTGKEDDLTPEQITGWQIHTRKTCRPYFFEGGHFFLHNAKPEILSLINTVLRETLVSGYAGV